MKILKKVPKLVAKKYGAITRYVSGKFDIHMKFRSSSTKKSTQKVKGSTQRALHEEQEALDKMIEESVYTTSMNQNLIAKAEIVIATPINKVWEALTRPDIIKHYMFGTEVVSDWTPGSTIVWKGIWKDKPYEDKGTILRIQPPHVLQYSHFSPLSGVPDVPENYHTLTYKLFEEDNATKITLSQDNNANEQALAHSQKMWEGMLAGLKAFLEK